MVILVAYIAIFKKDSFMRYLEEKEQELNGKKEITEETAEENDRKTEE